MKRSTTVRALMDEGKKKNVAKILKRIGVNHSEAINIFYSLIEEYKGFPFKLRVPDINKENIDSEINPEVINHLKDSIKKNRRLGELLTK